VCDLIELELVCWRNGQQACRLLLKFYFFSTTRHRLAFELIKVDLEDCYVTSSQSHDKHVKDAFELTRLDLCTEDDDSVPHGVNLYFCLISVINCEVLTQQLLLVTVAVD